VLSFCIFFKRQRKATFQKFQSSKCQASLFGVNGNDIPKYQSSKYKLPRTWVALLRSFERRQPHILKTIDDERRWWPHFGLTILKVEHDMPVGGRVLAFVALQQATMSLPALLQVLLEPVWGSGLPSAMVWTVRSVAGSFSFGCACCATCLTLCCTLSCHEALC
jgi:hypothetical protein